VKLLYVPLAVCVPLFVYFQTVRASPLRPTGDVTETGTHPAAGVEVTEMHQYE